MRRLGFAFGLSLFVSAGNASAADPPTEPTLFQPLPRSMQQLLDSGYQIITMSAGLGGYAYLLKQDQIWVTCALQPATNDQKTFVSQCMKMN